MVLEHRNGSLKVLRLLKLLPPDLSIPSIKIVYYQHLLVSFEELLSLRLPVITVANWHQLDYVSTANWLNLAEKKMRVRCSQALSPPLCVLYVDCCSCWMIVASCCLLIVVVQPRCAQPVIQIAIWNAACTKKFGEAHVAQKCALPSFQKLETNWSFVDGDFGTNIELESTEVHWYLQAFTMRSQGLEHTCDTVNYANED